MADHLLIYGLLDFWIGGDAQLAPRTK